MCLSLAGVGLVASSFGVITIEGNTVFILECTAEDIQGTSYSQVYAPFSGVVHRLKAQVDTGSDYAAAIISRLIYNIKGRSGSKVDDNSWLIRKQNPCTNGVTDAVGADWRRGLHFNTVIGFLIAQNKGL